MSCTKCETVGRYTHTGNKVVFTELNAPKRTDEKFRSGAYSVPVGIRKDCHCKKTTVITKLPIDMIEDIIIADSLHLIDLGEFKINVIFVNNVKLILF